MGNNDTVSLETLTQTYNSLLQSYNNTVNQYISYLKNNSTGQDLNGNLEEIPKMQIINGISVINSKQANTVDDCKALCSSITNCTMANYNSDSKKCVIGTTNGTVTLNKSKDTDYAILVDKIYYTTLLSNLNDQLNTTNTSIMNLLSNEGNNQYSNLDSKNNVKSQLKMNNDLLTTHQNDMQGISKDISLLELKHINTESELLTNSYYYWFLFLLVFIFIVFYFVS